MVLEIHCNVCGSLLIIRKDAHGRYTERITVDPCPKCLEAAQQGVQRTAIQPAPIEEFVRDLKNYIESDDD